MKNWANKAVMITGGAGFIGAHLAQRLVAEGAVVWIVDNLERGSEENLGSARDSIEDRKSTRLNSSHKPISYAVFCLKKKKKQKLAPAS